MRQISLIVLLIISMSCSIVAQQAEIVYSFARQMKPHEWQVEQARLWWQEIESNPDNEMAWYYYWRANRNAQGTFGKHTDWENKTWIDEGPYLMEGDSIVKLVEEKLPGTFISHYLVWCNDGANPDNFSDLQKAYELNPDFYGIDENFVVYYETKHNIEKRGEFNRKCFEKNEFSPGLLNYNYNVLMPLDREAIILSNGDNDTFPFWLLQDVLNVRCDVQLVNIHLLAIDDYRETMFDKLNIPQWERPEAELDSDFGSTLSFQERIVKHILDNKPANRPLYIALTMWKNLYQDYEDKLYIAGLALKYSDENFDNIAVLRKNFEQLYRLDYLYQPMTNDLSQGLVDLANLNYIPGLAKLYKHYKLTGEKQQAEEVKTLALLLAEKGGSNWMEKAQEMLK